MKEQPVSARQATAWRALAALGPVIEGSLCQVTRGHQQRWQLTDRPAGRTRTLYVPAARAAEVREWTENWKKAKKLLRDLSTAARADLRVTAGRADAPLHRPSTAQ